MENRVSVLCPATPITLPPDATIQEAIVTMLAHNIGALLIVGTDGKLVGIFSLTFLLSSVAGWAIQRSRMLSRMQLAHLQMEFVASVSHELRTPLAVIRSAADNLADGVIRDQDAMRRYGTILQHQSRSMGELVDQILLFASTEDRTNRYVLEPVAVEKVINCAVADTESLVNDAGFTLDVEVEGALLSLTAPVPASEAHSCAPDAEVGVSGRLLLPGGSGLSMRSTACLR